MKPPSRKSPDLDAKSAKVLAGSASFYLYERKLAALEELKKSLLRQAF